MLNRYLKITPLMKYTIPVDLEVSGFKLFSGDNQVDISTATVRINFNPVAGNAGMVLRSVITEGEALVIPANKTRGTGAIYIDLGENKNFDAFQIGFGSTQAKSMTKLKVEYSNDGITYRRLADITYNVRLKYRNPWTFSGLTTDAKTGFPGFLQRSLHHQYVNRDYDSGNRNEGRRTFSEYISEDGLRLFTRRHSEDFFANSNYYGTQSMMPVSSHLRPGKYYFEVSSESGMNEGFFGVGTWVRHAGLYMGVHMETKNSGQTGGSWGDWIASPVPGSAWPTESAYFSLSTKYNGRRNQDQYYTGTMAVSGGPVPDNFMAYPGGKKGLLAGFTVDINTGNVKVVNSPFTPDFQFEDSAFRAVFNNSPNNEDKRVYFTLLSPGKVDATNLDLTFNFGQKPFQGPVPEGFTDRIGMRWEVEIDPDAPVVAYPDYEDRSINIRPANNRYGPNDTEFDFVNPRNSRDMVINPAMKYYVKGKVADIDGKFFKRTMEIYTFPQMELMGSCGSSTEDGTYEFLYLSYRDYVVVSSDNQNGKFQSEIIGPLKPTLMDPTK